MKPTTSQGFSDDIWCVTGFSGDDFSIDEFFDLPNEDTNKNSSFLEEEEEEEKYSSSLSLSSQDPVDDSNSNSHNFSPDLAIPDDDLQELELWSHLMDDSVPEAAFACPKPLIGFQLKKTVFNIGNRFEPGRKQGLGKVPFIPSAVPVKPRSKRVRTAGNYTWFTGSLPKPESSSSSSSSSSSPVSTLVFPNPVHDMVFPFGKPKKKPASVSREVGSSTTVQRRCTHCQVTKTPQWRAGPNGPKTLCNACGVRFKSGRLFPEYRPACSPTFSIAVHSNSHRKVLEMRRKKEKSGSETGLTPTVCIN